MKNQLDEEREKHQNALDILKDYLRQLRWMNLLKKLANHVK